MANNKNSNEPKQLILPFHTLDTLRIRIGWIINIRWVEIFGLLVVTPIAQRILNFKIAYEQLYVIAVILLGLNLIYFFLFRYFPFKNFRQELAFTEVQIVLDLIIISFLVHYIGGIGNPFFFIYLVNIIISDVLLLGNIPYINAILASLFLTIWSYLEYKGYIQIYTIRAEPVRLSVMITSLGAFYLLTFAVTYVIKDVISGYRQLKKLIDIKSAQLEHTIQERDKIFRFTAHELKSPLTTLRSMLAVIEEVYASKLDVEVSNMIRRSVIRTDQILDMVKDMIDVTHYRHTGGDRIIEEVNYKQWIDKIVSQLSCYAEHKSIKINVVEIDPDLVLSFDNRAFEKVLINLINNAIRYSPENTTITITPFFKGNLFGFSVSDQGIGISKEDLPKIFDEFFRSKRAREMERLGTGLGLSLIKQIVEQNGGNVYVESKEGKGSTFTVEIPS
ncbi:MAG: HAMP domain-containing histidine kinase [Candidatus Marinimicrobia bacterium]|nr:HAMP domain-containing histidine kinase [Candidatus Neomarinimicrobiota bacterium]